MLALIAALQAPLFLPVHSAYRPSSDILLWGGYFATTGVAHVEVDRDNSAAQIADKEELIVRGKRMMRFQVSHGADVPINSAGWYRLELAGAPKEVTELRISGDVTTGAKFNVKERRNAASVHIRWPVPSGQEGEWFYNEVKGLTDPLYTYYMACGFRRGYFGMQVNSPTERRVIFSIWDSGKEAIDRNKVDQDDRCVLLAKGKGVFADSFGNEGTGGHSHLVYDWKTGEKQRFLVHAVPDGDRTVYTAYFKASDAENWILIASFRAPKDGHSLSGLYSFIEDFGGEYGYQVRRAAFGEAWVRTKEGNWIPLDKGQFTHDGTGGKDRFDYDFKSIHGGFLLQNGGFEGSSPEAGTTLTTQYGRRPPQIDFAALPSAVAH